MCGIMLQQSTKNYKAYSVGLDASLTSFGVYCAPLGDHNEWYGFAVKTTPKDGPDLKRVLSIAQMVEDTVNALPYTVGVVGIEDYGPINRTSGKIAQRAEIVGILKKFVLIRLHVPIILIAPKALKKFATGNGNASKSMMLDEANRRGYYPDTNDEADAMFIALAATEAMFTGNLSVGFSRINP